LIPAKNGNTGFDVSFSETLGDDFKTLVLHDSKRGGGGLVLGTWSLGMELTCWGIGALGMGGGGLMAFGCKDLGIGEGGFLWDE